MKDKEKFLRADLDTYKPKYRLLCKYCAVDNKLIIKNKNEK